MQLLLLDLGAFFFFFFVKSRVSCLSAVSTAWITLTAAHLLSPSCSHCTSPSCLFWAIFLISVQTLPRGAAAPCKAVLGAPCTCSEFGLSSFCIPRVQVRQPLPVHQRVQCPTDGFHTLRPRLPSPFPNSEGKTLCYRVQAAFLGRLGAWPALLKDGVYIALLHPGSTQPRAAFG